MPRTASQLPGRWLLLPAFFFSVLVNLLMLTGPLFMLQVYDRVLSSRSRETLVALVILVLALYALMWLLDFSRGRVLARFGAVVQNRFDAPALRSRLFGGAAHRCDPQDLEHFQAFSASPALTAILDTPFAPAFIVIIFILHPMLGWLALIGGGVLVALTILNEVLTAGRRQRIQKMAEESRSFAEQVAREAEVVRAQGMTDATVAQWADARHRTLTAALSAEDVTSLLSSLTKSARLALQSLILALGAWLALDGQITAGAMIAASILLGRALAPIEQMLARWPQIDRARRAWASIRVLAGDPTEAPQATRLPRPAARLDLRGVTLTGGPGTPARLYNLSASLPPGTALGVLGKSGSGKTTLARVLVGLERPTVGEVRLSGALLDQYGSDLGSHIGYLPQNAGLLPGSLARNIARMSETPDTDKMIAAARKAGVHDMILALPQGYDTMVDAAAQPLSGGQKQRVALARALYGDPAILILDEPNSALDAEGTAALNQAIRIAKDEGRSVVVMTHRPAAISECDSLLVLEAGKMTAYGPRDAVLKSLMRADGTTMAPGPRAIA